jgi:hypothetical protein
MLLPMLASLLLGALLCASSISPPAVHGRSKTVRVQPAGKSSGKLGKSVTVYKKGKGR